MADQNNNDSYILCLGMNIALEEAKVSCRYCSEGKNDNQRYRGKKDLLAVLARAENLLDCYEVEPEEYEGCNVIIRSLLNLCRKCEKNSGEAYKYLEEKVKNCNLQEDEVVQCSDSSNESKNITEGGNVFSIRNYLKK